MWMTILSIGELDTDAIVNTSQVFVMYYLLIRNLRKSIRKKSELKKK